MENAKLYVVAIPIGNTEDITFRAARILKEADCVACEDTRVTASLLAALGISAELIPYHEYNKKEASLQIIRKLKNGESVALVSDAGTPCISDPGYLVVKKAREEGIDVIPVPGPSAFTGALSVSGFASDRFIFEGFLVSGNESKRRKRLEELVSSGCTFILYEAPHRINRLLVELDLADPEAEVFIGREMTKKYEQFITGKPGELLAYFETKKPKGEFVVIVNKRDIKIEMSPEEINDEYRVMTEKGICEKDAMKSIARRTGKSKSEIYGYIKK